ncbi:MAG TPA: thioester domain-containing protein, partial [Puia sp.]|nr:thioester domain-containing protein [Puia sp.]
PFKDQAWQLPAGIELAEKFHHFMYCAQLADTPTTTDLKNFKGVPGGLFILCFTLHNNRNYPITIDFPEELAIVSSSIHSQNGLLIALGQVIVPPNSSLTLFAGGFCLNEGRTAPDVYDENGGLLFYDLGPSVVPRSLKEITGILSTKHIGFEDVVNASGTQYDNDKYAKAFVIQKAIWEVTDGEGLTDKTRLDLKSLSF